jgi:hypothetical protein
VLAGHQEVAQAVVVARQDRLTAYVVAAESAVPALRELVRDRLPDYMVPAAIVPLEAFPLTPNGKIDRTALPDPEYPHPPDDSGPRTETERAVHRIWCQVLGRERCGMREKFFDGGGTSLTLLTLRNQLSRLCGEELPVALLFEHLTIEAMARAIDQRRLASTDDPREERRNQHKDQNGQNGQNDDEESYEL